MAVRERLALVTSIIALEFITEIGAAVAGIAALCAGGHLILLRIAEPKPS